MTKSTGERDTEAFRVFKGDLLLGPSSCYLVDSFLGEGSFGKVAKCLKSATSEWVAVKIIKDRPDLIAQAEHEIAILQSLRELDPDRCAIVRWNGYFEDKRHICLEFELLGINLHDLLNQAQALNFDSIRIILKQLAAALGLLQLIGIIHGDIKPENIMLVDDSLHVKIIDFGLSCRVSEAKVGASMGTMWYHAPELLLGLPFAGAIDVWALGCVAMDLFTGYPIYPGESQYQMLQYITETQGPFPKMMLDSGIYAKHYFTSTHNLKCPATYYHETGIRTDETRFYHLESLDVPVLMDVDEGMVIFMDLVKKMLHLEASQRISPTAILDHPFSITSTAAAAIKIQDNPDHTHASNNQPISEKGPDSPVSRQPQRDEDDIGGNSTSSVMVTVDALTISEHSTPVADILPEVTIRSWSSRFRGFFCRLRKTLCCCCCPTEEELS